MRILFLADLETRGGAAIAATRLARGLARAGVDVARLSGIRASDSPGEPAEWESLDGALPRMLEVAINGLRRIWPGPARKVAIQLASRQLHAALKPLKFDILHVHAIHNSFWNHGTLASTSPDIPTVWTFHDFWGFSPESYRFQDLDGKWVRLKPDGEDREAARQRRLRYFSSRRHLGLVGNSVATARMAQEALGRDVGVIHYGLPLEIYTPRPQEAARLSLGLPPDAFVLGFSADNTADPIKGFRVLEGALSALNLADVHAVAMGSGSHGAYQIGSTQVHSLGRIDNPRLQAIVYSAADVFVVPSLAEALGQVAMEAVACGTPVLASSTGGLVDVVEPDRTGWLFSPGDISDLRRHIEALATDPGGPRALRVECRRFAEAQWSLERQARDYLGLYQAVLRDTDNRG
jgi:glycosyltransferase involved in cell wall biosynthesis